MISSCTAADVRFHVRPKITECWISSRENHGEGVGVLKSVTEFLRQHKLDPVSIRLFGDSKALIEATSLLDAEYPETACSPLMIIQDHFPRQTNLQVQVYALSEGHSSPLYYENTPVGRVIQDEHATWYSLRILPVNEAVNPHDQTRSIFEKAHAILSGYGSGFSDTVRTWLFADHILSWYGQLNKARNQYFEEHGIYQQLVPASTGIGTANLHGKHLASQLLAVKATNGVLRRHSVESPLQCSALDYKSSFSRAVQLDCPDHSKLFISGTAAIDKTGKTAFVGDAGAQIALTMQVVEAILDRAQMDWSNAVSSLVYFKDHRNFGVFDEYCRHRGIRLPHLKLQADVCRNDLLFEIELDAVCSLDNNSPSGNYNKNIDTKTKK